MPADDALTDKHNSYRAACADAIYANDFQLLVYQSPAFSDGEPTAAPPASEELCCRSRGA